MGAVMAGDLVTLGETPLVHLANPSHERTIESIRRLNAEGLERFWPPSAAIFNGSAS